METEITRNSVLSIFTHRLLEFGSNIRKRRAIQSTPKTQPDAITNETVEQWTVLLEYHALPHWLQWNEFVHSGYRPPMPSWKHIFYSVFSIHNETVNIWSHLLGSFIFLYLLISNFTLPPEERSWLVKLALAPFLFGFFLCLTLSYIFHAISCHSEPVYTAACCCDYLGITVAMLGGLYTVMFFQWFCSWHIGLLYCTFYTSIAPIGFCIFMHTAAAKKNGKGYRALLGMVLGISAFTSLFHDLSLRGMEYVFSTFPMHLVLIIFVQCVLAAIVYGLRLPERVWPGKFDLCGHSHQIFHTMVVGIALYAYNNFVSYAKFKLPTLNYTSCDYETLQNLGIDLTE